jgi:hypothetical protein
MTPIVIRINPIPRMDTQFFKVHYNIAFPPMPRLPKSLFPVGLPINILKAPLLLP